MPHCGKCNKCKSEKKHDEVCHTKCERSVTVDSDLHPHVRCTEEAHRRTKFDIELDIKAKPKCCIRKHCIKRTHDCRHKAIFEVEVDVDFACKPKVHHCPSTSAKFDLDVRL